MRCTIAAHSASSAARSSFLISSVVSCSVNPFPLWLPQNLSQFPATSHQNGSELLPQPL